MQPFRGTPAVSLLHCLLHSAAVLTSQTLLQAYYLATPFAIERAPTRLLPEWNLPGGEVTVSALEEYPVRGLVFETTGAPESMGHLLGR